MEKESSMKMKSIISLYLAKTFLKSFLIVVLCFTFIIAALESMEIIRRYFSNSIAVSYGTILKLTYYHTVVNTFSFFSFAVFLAVVLFFVKMHNRLEITVMRAMGISVSDIIKSLFAVVLSLGIFYITLLDGISARSIEKIASLSAELKQNSRGIRNNNLTVTNKGVWFRDAYESNSYIIHANQLNAKNKSLFKVKFFKFNEDDKLELFVYAQTAAISNGQWLFNDAKVVYADGNEETLAVARFPTNLKFSHIKKMLAAPDSISFWNIKNYISLIEKVGLSSARYITNWISRLSNVFQMFAFVVFATAFCINYNSRNTKRYLLKVLLLLTTAFPIYFFKNVLTTFAGNSGNVSICFLSFVVPIFTMVAGLVAQSSAKRKFTYRLFKS
ncbi:MAG: LptF/LptG family permease [Holosporales bacterium]|jgi:lipopolysaccharide export system permease protein|nr:LptF/LptG family permease [Holosporales bacterium]